MELVWEPGGVYPSGRYSGFAVFSSQSLETQEKAAMQWEETDDQRNRYYQLDNIK